MTSRNRVTIELYVDDKGTVHVKQFAGETEKSFKKMERQAETSTSKMGGHLQKLKSNFVAVSVGVGVALLALKKMYDVASQFLVKFATWEVSLTDMKKVSSEKLSAIKAKIMELPPALGTSIELVKGYYQVISAGVKNPKRALDTLVQASRTAKAAHVDQAEVIKGLTKLMAGYEGEIENVSEAADLLFAIEKEGQTNVAELIPVIGGLAKISHDLGVSQDEMGASLALVTQTAGSTAEAATQYQGVLMALLKPTEAMQAAIRAMGFESAEAAIKQLGFAETLRQLKAQAAGSSEAMAEMFGRVEGLKGMSALAANEFRNLGDKVTVMEEKTGKAADAWKDYKETSASAYDSLKASIDKVTIAIGKGLAPAAKNLAHWLSDAAEYWTKLFRGPQEGPALGEEMLEDYRRRVIAIKEELLEIREDLKSPDMIEYKYGGLEQAHEQAKALHAELARIEAKIKFLTQPPETERKHPPVPELPDVPEIQSPFDYETWTPPQLADSMDNYIKNAKEAAAILNAPPFDWEQWLPPAEVDTSMEEYVKKAKEMAAIEYAEPFDYEQWITGYDEIEDKGTRTFSELENAVTGWANTFSRQLSDMLWTADTTFGDILESFGRMLTQMVIQKQVVEPLLGAVFATPKASAQGNVFSGPGITAYENKIVDRPTFFPFAHGIGLMGEGDRHEAIMPLTRTRSGDLGVKTEGTSPNIQINMINQTGQPLSAQQRGARQESGRWVIDVVVNELRRGRTLRQAIRSTT